VVSCYVRLVERSSKFDSLLAGLLKLSGMENVVVVVNVDCNRRTVSPSWFVRLRRWRQLHHSI